MRASGAAIPSKRRRLCTYDLRTVNSQSILTSQIPISKPPLCVKLSHVPSSRSKKTFESIEIDDIFTKLMGFFVTPSAIDVDTVSSILYVSKAWNVLSTRPAVWIKSQQAVIMPRKSLVQDVLHLISDRLIGFRNLGQFNKSGTLSTKGRSFFVSDFRTNTEIIFKNNFSLLL